MNNFSAPKWMTMPAEGAWGCATAAPRMSKEQVAQAAADPDFEIPDMPDEDEDEDEEEDA